MTLEAGGTYDHHHRRDAPLLRFGQKTRSLTQLKYLSRPGRELLGESLSEGDTENRLSRGRVEDALHVRRTEEVPVLVEMGDCGKELELEDDREMDAYTETCPQNSVPSCTGFAPLQYWFTVM